MKLVDRWTNVTGRAWERMPTLVQGILVPWILIGLVVAFVPDLQQMPDLVRFVIGLPAGLAMLWMAIGFYLLLADKLIGLLGRISRRKAR